MRKNIVSFIQYSVNHPSNQALQAFLTKTQEIKTVFIKFLSHLGCFCKCVVVDMTALMHLDAFYR